LKSQHTRILFCLACLVLAACGACPAVEQNRQAFLGEQRSEQPDRGHHILVAIPKKLIDKGVDKAFKAMPDVPIKLPGLGNLNRYIKSLKFKPRKLGIDFDRTSAAQIRLDLDAFYGRAKLFSVDLAAVAPVKYNPKTQTATLIIRYDIFKTVTPRLSRGAADNLTKLLRKQLPSLVRAVFPTSKVRRYASKSLNALLKELYPLLRKRMLKPMGELTRFKFHLPDVPIERITMLSTKNTWQLGIRTSLAARGLTPKETKLAANQLRFSLSSDVLAKLGNWAIAKGKIPASYNRRGKPDKKGDFVAGFGWESDRSPLKVKMWSKDTSGRLDASTCLFVQAGATPTVALRGKKMKVGFKNGRIEDVIGPPFIKQALDLMGISRRAFNFSKSIALNQRLRLGTKSFGLTLKEARFTNRALRFDMILDD